MKENKKDDGDEMKKKKKVKNGKVKKNQRKILPVARVEEPSDDKCLCKIE